MSQQNDDLIKQNDETSKLVNQLNQIPQQTQQQVNNKKRIPAIECEEGRIKINNKQYLQASKHFSKALMAFQFLVKDGKLTKEQIVLILKQSVIPSYSNLALCYLKIGSYQSAIECATQVLAHNNAHIKSLYRRGLAYKAIKQFDKAIEDFEKLKKLDLQEQNLANQQILSCRKMIKAQKQKQRKFAGQLLKGYEHQEQPKSKQQKLKQLMAEIQQYNNSSLLKSAQECIKKICNKLQFWKRS